ncbi:hypothetical protein GQ600_8538 [Phytophthora cactorum]|nr:hypothetical protein GQ600_8538 [Phytophthora cactorum]
MASSSASAPAAPSGVSPSRRRPPVLRRLRQRVLDRTSAHATQRNQSSRYTAAPQGSSVPRCLSSQLSRIVHEYNPSEQALSGGDLYPPETIGDRGHPWRVFQVVRVTCSRHRDRGCSWPAHLESVTGPGSVDAFDRLQDKPRWCSNDNNALSFWASISVFCFRSSHSPSSPDGPPANIPAAV